MYVKLGEFIFSSDFECGNLAKVVPLFLADAGTDTSTTANPVTFQSSKVGKVSNFTEDSTNVHNEFNLWTKPDCAGTPFENNNRTWFYFSIAGGLKGQRARLVLMNLNKQYKLFSQGMLPVVQYEHENGTRTKWERIKEKCFYKSEEGSTIISWIHNVTSEKNTSYYAFTYPYSYSDLDTHLTKCDALAMKFSNIYFHRELLVKSLDGNRVDLLTISSKSDMLSEREDAIPGLFTSSEVSRACRFKDKKVVFLSARVHPGETSSSFVMNGLLNFILSDDPRAVRLRDIVVFKLIPMLNPDGVVRGHYRSDQRGINLNRVYVRPTLEAHPTIYASRQIILYHHYKMSIELLLENEHSSIEATSAKADDIRLPLIDEDTCHSFSDAAKKNVGVGTTVTNQKTVEADELSASCWDVSSNISTENYPAVGPAVQPLDVSEMHDDCSNLSFASETETGVTNMFRSLSPNKFDSQSFCFQSRKALNTFESCVAAQETSSQPFLTVDQSSRMYSTAELSSSSSNIDYFSKQTNSPSISPSKLMTSSPKIKKYCRAVGRKSQGDVTPSMVGWKTDCKLSTRNQLKCQEAQSGLYLYVDLHGHASKRGIFIYGNWFEDSDMMVENMLFPKLLSLNCPNFDFSACNFSERNMYIKDKRDGMSKEGSGRVAVMRATGILRSYTLECNYNTGRTCNQIPHSPLTLKKGISSSSLPPKYTPSIFEDCGSQLAVSLLDVLETHQWSRIPFSQFSSLNGIRSSLHCLLTSSSGSARNQSVSAPNTPYCRSAAKLTVSEQIEPGTSMDNVSQIVKSSPKIGRMRTRARRNSWAFSVDAENREPPTQRESSLKKGFGAGLRMTRLTKKNVARSLTFTEQNEAFSLKPALVATTVTLTPDINVHMSVGDVQPSKVVKKLDKPRKQRRKSVPGGSKKLKMGSGSLSETTSIGFSLPGIDLATPLSPRSPLASVCEPQSSQTTAQGLLVNLIQPKSPIGMVTSLPAKPALRIGKLHKRSKKVESDFSKVSSSASWPIKETSDVLKPKFKRRKKIRGRKSL